MIARVVAPLVACCMFGSTASAFAQQATVAIPAIKAAGNSGKAQIEAEIAGSFRGAGYRVLQERDLKRFHGGALERARAAGAAMIVEAAIGHAKGKFTLRADLVDVGTRETKGTGTASYRNAKEAGRAGQAVAATLVQSLLPSSASLPGAPSAANTASPTPAPVEDAPAAAPAARTEAPPPATADNTPTARVAVEPERPAKTGGLVELHVGAGSQVSSSYDVNVGSQSTGLGYHLSALLLVAGGARLNLGHFGVEADFALSPVTLVADTTPVVTPNKPGAHFLDFGADLVYTLNLGRPTVGARSTADLEPLLGVAYESFSVDAQSPFNVFLSESTVLPRLGVRFRLVPTDAFEIAIQGEGRLTAGFSESPVTTGNSGSGFGLMVLGEARYWLTNELALAAGVSWRRLGVTFTGTGTRPTFENAPMLSAASLTMSNLRVYGQAVLAL
jgi:hypothetical protein